jgi:hypothetical protein
MKKRKRPHPVPVEEDAGTSLPGILVLLVMTSVAVAAVAWGCHRNGLVWRNVLAAASCLSAGIAFVAIGLFELEWLERLVGFADGIVSGVMYYFWTSWFGTLSDSEFVGRTRARVIFLVFGPIVFLAGCVLALGLL